MGRGIAQVCATADHEVTVRDVEPDLVVEAVPEEMELKRETAAAVEVVAAEQTAAETVEFAAEFVEWIGKEPVVIRDTPGFATSRLGVAIDRAMELGERFRPPQLLKRKVRADELGRRTVEGSTSGRTANASPRAATGTSDEPRGRARRKT
jgi:3-hydroxyacyl-CoA dehydrogenase